MSTEAWKTENTTRYNIRFLNSSGIPGALQKVAETTGESGMSYIRRVVSESLINDGYLEPPKPKRKRKK